MDPVPRLIATDTLENTVGRGDQMGDKLREALNKRFGE
jgi:hypothetical protein